MVGIEFPYEATPGLISVTEDKLVIDTIQVIDSTRIKTAVLGFFKLQVIYYR
jgi:hypothetical protein